VETIGKYQIQRVIGRGGMGTVYEALDPLLHRKIAIKVMIQGLAESPDLRARFLREAQAAGGLRHRNIVTVYDLGEDGGQPYIAMEFIEGTDLEKIIQTREPRPLEWKLDVIRQVCDGLAYAHKNGIVHRDVKPANIRVTPEGEVKIMDFGIAHLQSSTMTKSGLVLGTVHYMSPEQIEGQHKADHRADIFSVGTIAYELIAHRRPFEGESLTAVMFKITHEDPDPSPLANTPFSPGLEQTILKALARDVSARYQRLDDMYGDLDRLLRREPAAAAAPPPAPQDPPRDEAGELRGLMAQALSEGQLQKALGFCRRLIEIRPGDLEATKVASEIESSIRDREVEDLCRMALSYASDGETELARKIAAKIARIAPQSKRLVQLQKYLDEEQARRQAEVLTGSAREFLALGKLAEALASAEEALALYPQHAVAREIRERTSAVLAATDHRPPAPAPEEAVRSTPSPESVEAPTAAPSDLPPHEETPAVTLGALHAPPPQTPGTAPPSAESAASPASEPRADAPGEERAPEDSPPSPASPQPRAGASGPSESPAPQAPRNTLVPLTPLPEGTPSSPEAAHLVEAARRNLRERAPEKALPLLEKAATLEPIHPGVQRLLSQTRTESRKAEIESLTTAALDAFVQNNYGKAKKAVERTLALDPANRKARELQKILGALG
jgi:serine/threonine protein kinase